MSTSSTTHSARISEISRLLGDFCDLFFKPKAIVLVNTKEVEEQYFVLRFKKIKDYFLFIVGLLNILNIFLILHYVLNLELKLV